MKRYLINLLLFLVAFVALNLFAYEYLATKTIYKNYLISNKTFANYSNYLIADSHGEVLQQSDLSSIGICNFSFSSDSYFDLLAKVEYLVKHTQIDTLYLSADNHTLSKYREWWNNKQRSIHYSSYTLHKKFYSTPLPEFIYKKNIAFYMPLLNTKNSKIFRAYLQAKISGKSTVNYDNFDYSTFSKEQRIKRSTERISTQFPPEGSSDFLEKCLNEIISLCESNQITLIGIKFPLTLEFIEMLDGRNFNADQILLDRGHEVLDFQRLYIDSPALFRDQDHLNLKGSARFIKVLNERNK